MMIREDFYIASATKAILRPLLLAKINSDQGMDK